MLNLKLFIYNHVVLPIFGDYIREDIDEFMWDNPGICSEVLQP